MSTLEEEQWRDLVERRCGIFFSPNRFYVLQNCLWTEMQNRGLEAYRDYYSLILRSAAEWERLVDRLVNRETYFFRHMPTFSALAEEFLPARIAEKCRSGGLPVRLWSAGCSSGEEAYSLAMAACDAGWPIGQQCQVLGTDLSAEALLAARRARYGERATSAMPADLRRRYFARRGSEYQVAPAIRAMVRFEAFNFFDPATYPTALQDVIVCQNVFIYFREEQRMQAAAGLAACLHTGGLLLTAPGEMASLEIAGLERVALRHTVAFRRNLEPCLYGQAAPAAQGAWLR
ncbi:MAG TPA: protein-glutamate O-methyltransferase CheR [Candidatus Acidoferrales bacterium]|nr:protein-glutamate O-methyltransferase CheR [Candidatus Acidoferrales bacterium]